MVSANAVGHEPLSVGILERGSLEIGQQTLGKHIAIEFVTGVCGIGRLNLFGGTQTVPNPDFIVVTTLVVVSGRRTVEHKVAETADTAIVRSGEHTVFFTVDIKIQSALVDDDGDVRPFVERKGRGTYEPCRSVPTAVEPALGIAMLIPCTPSRTGGIVPVGKGRRTYPELDGGLLIGTLENTGDGEASLTETVNLVTLGQRDGCRHLPTGTFLTVCVDSGYGKGGGGRFTNGVCTGMLVVFRHQFVLGINTVSAQFVCRSHRGFPFQDAVGNAQTVDAVVAGTEDNGGDDGTVALSGDFERAVLPEVKGSLHALKVVLIVYDSCLVDMSAALVRVLLAGDDEEILQRLVAVETGREVGKVVTELHGFGVEFAIGPTSEHRHGRSWRKLAVMPVAGIFEMVHGNHAFRLLGGEVRTHAGLQQQFRAVAVVHLQPYGAQRTVILADMVELSPPEVTVELAVGGKGGAGIGIGAIDETAVAPSAPRIDDNPCTPFVAFAVDAVTVKVKLYAVVVAHHREGMVHAGSPLSHIIHSGHTGLVVDGSLGDGFPFSARCHAEPDKASGMEGRIATMVPQPVLGKFRPGLGTHACHIRCGRRAAVVEGFEPFFVARHPSGILIVPLVIAEQAGIGLPAVGFGRGHPDVGDELVLAGVSVGQQPYEMCGEIVFGFHAVAVAVGVLFMTEHVGNARGGAARPGTLVEDGWKIACGGIVHMVGTSRSGGTPAS